MKIEWTGRGLTIPDRMRDRIVRGLEKLQRHLKGHTEAHVVLSQEGPEEGNRRQVAEIVVRNRLGTFTAQSESHDMVESVNAVLDKLDKQVRRAREKLKSRRRRGPSAAEVAPGPLEVGEG